MLPSQQITKKTETPDPNRFKLSKQTKPIVITLSIIVGVLVAAVILTIIFQALGRGGEAGAKARTEGFKTDVANLKEQLRIINEQIPNTKDPVKLTELILERNALNEQIKIAEKALNGNLRAIEVFGKMGKYTLYPLIATSATVIVLLSVILGLVGRDYYNHRKQLSKINAEALNIN